MIFPMCVLVYGQFPLPWSSVPIHLVIAVFLTQCTAPSEHLPGDEWKEGKKANIPLLFDILDKKNPKNYFFVSVLQKC